MKASYEILIIFIVRLEHMKYSSHLKVLTVEVMFFIEGFSYCNDKNYLVFLN